LHRILKLTKQNLNTLKEIRPLEIYLFDLSIYQQAIKEKSKADLDFLLTAANEFNMSSYTRFFKYLLGKTTMHRMFNYLYRQYKKHSKHYYFKNQVTITWRDYIDDCKKLKLDLSNEVILFPKDLRKAHEETIKKIKHVEDELMNQKAIKRYKQIKKYEFTSTKYSIVAPRAAKEIINEGEVLSHCVGRYIDNHIEGRTCILFLRENNKSDTPFYTIELSYGKIQQIRGFKNKPPTKDIEGFLDKFVQMKLTSPKKAKERKVV